MWNVKVPAEITPNQAEVSEQLRVHYDDSNYAAVDSMRGVIQRNGEEIVIPKSLISSDATVIVGEKGSVTIRRESLGLHTEPGARFLYSAIQDDLRARLGLPSQPTPQIVIGYQDRIYIGNYDKDPELEIGVVAQGDANGAGAGFQIYDVMAGGAVAMYGDVNFNLQIPEIGWF